MAILTLIQFSLILSFSERRFIKSEDIPDFYNIGVGKQQTAQLERKTFTAATKFPRKWAAALGLFVFAFFIKQKLRFILKSCLCTFSK